jgi:hypothetical protein
MFMFFMTIDFDHGQAPQQRPQAASLPRIEVPCRRQFCSRGQEEPWIDIIPEKYRDTVSGKMMILFLRFFPFPFLFSLQSIRPVVLGFKT